MLYTVRYDIFYYMFRLIVCPVLCNSSFIILFMLISRACSITNIIKRFIYIITQAI
ncbi:uncharacterized protein BX663DRAFT_518333 [Cokeromyces recurvatus]|uniref:uncharacterized protein n=1 Tax=Cokeromyces recurvatus TaxID=90255 RepID=UPI002220F5E9|nr:uncharacterized protein BX663DRAFT_518333 [Cokeromyces recurvatus]KAI7900345.1 hypothetical protein BX663DRAFT_518333 [Cokeromyces recurvatus]